MDEIKTALIIALVGVIGAAGKAVVDWIQTRAAKSAIDYIEARRLPSMHVSDHDAKRMMVARATATLPVLLRPSQKAVKKLIEKHKSDPPGALTDEDVSKLPSDPPPA